MKTAIYPGSFNPWHAGHDDIVRKALRVFDKVIIAAGHNPDKSVFDFAANLEKLKNQHLYGTNNGVLEVIGFHGLLADYVRAVNENEYKIHAVIRGLRNGQDFEFEKMQQYHNEDLLIGIPILYLISGRGKVHLSSTAIRAITKARGEKYEP